MGVMQRPSTLSELAAGLSALTDAAGKRLAAIGDHEWREPYAPGKWTRIEVLGHLLDSAAHNHQRFARAMHDASLNAPGYDGDAQVRAQHYAQAPAAVLVDAWRAQNRLISYVLAQIPAAKEETPCSVASSPRMTLRDLAFDYVAHLEHHLRQILGRDEAPYSGLPWPPEGRWQ